MTSDKPEKVAKTSVNMEDENLQKLRAVFPNFVKDGVIDFDALKAFFDKEGTLAGTEKYGLNWAGKGSAFKAIRTPSTGTLVPQEKESKNFAETENVFIEGDNLEVLKLLQKHYREQIKMIYIDPPYNTGKDFIYTDNFTENKNDYYERTGQSCDGIKLTSNPESNGRYHSDWLTMMYPRLFLARNLLREDGVIFVSIDDHEVANLRMIMDEVFGEENFVESFIWRSRLGKGSTSTETATIHEYILCYAKNIEIINFAGDVRVKEKDTKERLRQWGQGDKREDRPSMYFPVHHEVYGDVFPIKPDGSDGRWRASKESVQSMLDQGILIFEKQEDGRVEIYKNIVAGSKTETAQDSILDGEIVKTTAHGSKENSEIFDGKIFDYPKPTTLLKHFLRMVDDSSAVVLDFFAGSGTTAHAVMDLNAEDGGNRKWICVQIPEGTNADSEACKAGYLNIAQISRERIRRAGEKVREEFLQKKLPERRGLQEVYGYKDREIGELEGDATRDFDFGFKSFSLSPSNYSEWNVLTDKDDEATLKKQSKLFIEQPLVAGFDEKSVVYEILLKEGFDLNAKVDQVKGDLSPWIVTAGDKKLVVTFAKKVTKSQVESLALSDLDTLVCLDSALDDTTKVNIMRNLIVKTI